MATMIPNDTDEFKTDGERRFYRFLESAAKPDHKYTTWYLPDIEGREPDFILFCEDVGLIIFEVKDWALQQIEEANPRNFVLKMGREKRSLKNPLQQAREYFESLMHRMRVDGMLLSVDPGHYGKPKVPVDYGVVFPNISRNPYCQSGLDQVISPRRVFFLEDLHPDSPVCTDGSGECFKKTLREMFPPRFRFKLTPVEYGHLKQLLFPVVRIDPPQRDTCAYIDLSQRLSVLDDRQEAIARRYRSSRQILSGPSGSGKTLILACKAAFLKQYSPAKRILFVCSNIALVNYIKRLLTEKGVGLGPEGVEVYHFFELCSKILGIEIQFEEKDGDYYRMVAEETLATLRGSAPRYDAVLVDEGQDFTDEMIAVVEALLDKDGQNLTIAMDEAQNIRCHPLAWKKRQIRQGARVDELSALYRNSAEIRELAFKFMAMSASRFAGAANPHQEANDTSCEAHGPKPELVQMDNLHRIFTSLADTLRMLRDRREYPLSEMAVLYTRHRSPSEEATSVPEHLAAALESGGIMSNWLAQDYRSKRFYDITTDRVTLSSIRSAAGLDYACVFLVGLDDLEELSPGSEIEERTRRLVYTGITRARHRLIIPYVHKTRLIGELLSCL